MPRQRLAFYSEPPPIKVTLIVIVGGRNLLTRSGEVINVPRFSDDLPLPERAEALA
jgi:hypothetical protein